MMKKKEAINILESMLAIRLIPYHEREAIQTALDALKWLEEEEEHERRFDDLISRQQAIDKAKKRHDFFRGATTQADKARRDELLEMTVWLSELPSVQPEPIKINIEDFNKEDWERFKKEWGNTPITVLPAQSDRDIPMKPLETTDKAWGIPRRQAVCPKCDYYLGHVAFLGDYKGKRVTYCETCGQAIDWEGWGNDEHND